MNGVSGTDRAHNMDGTGLTKPMDGSVAIGVDEPRNPEKFHHDEISFDPFFEDEHAGAEKSMSMGGASSMRDNPITLEWHDLCYSVRTSSGSCFRKKTSTTKQVLYSADGIARPSQLVAIMGASGAGKTTLLNMLAGRLTTSGNISVSGQVLVNGQRRNHRTFKQMAAYVEQDDNMFAELTVEEQISFSANLRLPSSYSSVKRKERVDRVIVELGLDNVRHSRIGNNLVRGVSGGERKRVNIGTELVTNPSLIFLDEPTTGLDAFNALNVMKALRRLAGDGRTILSTIHQPRSNIFSLFDQLLLLSAGRVMYFGSAKDAVHYFSSLNFTCPSQFNPADYFIDLLSMDYRSDMKKERSAKRIEFVGHMHEMKKDAQVPQGGVEGEKVVEELEEEEEQQPPMMQDHGRGKYSSSYPAEMYYLCGRQFRAMIRERAGNTARLGQTIVFSLLLGVIWVNVGRNYFANPERSALSAIVGVMFFACVNQTFGGVFSVIFVYPLERSIVNRERASGTYRVLSYMVSKTVVELPRTIFFVLLFTTVVYWMIYLKPTASAFFLTVTAICFVSMCAESLTIAVSTFAPNAQVAAAIAPVFIIVSLLFAGFFIQGGLIPDWLEWIQYLSFIKYGFTAIMLTQFEGDPNEGYVNAEYGNVSRPLCFVMLFVLWFSFRALSYLFLRLRGPKYGKNL